VRNAIEAMADVADDRRLLRVSAERDAGDQIVVAIEDSRRASIHGNRPSCSTLSSRPRPRAWGSGWRCAA